MTWQLDHVQIAIPKGGEGAARAFWVGLIGMREVAKPAALAGRGGLWLTRGTVHLHLGVDDRFRPAAKAHPCLSVDDLDSITAALTAAGHPFETDTKIVNVRRVFVGDPFGNRIEVMQAP